MKKTRSFLALSLGAIALTACLPEGSAVTRAHADPIAPVVAAGVATAPLAPGRYGLPDFAELVERVGPAVVNISTTQQLAVASGPQGIDPNDPFYDFLRRFGVPMPGTPPHGNRGPRGGDGPERRGIGSGFIVSADGYVLTNAHVVSHASTVTVRLTDKREFKAKVVGTDKRTDVALLKIDATGLPNVTIGDADQSRSHAASCDERTSL